jgi:predicted aspartyl protease
MCFRRACFILCAIFIIHLPPTAGAYPKLKELYDHKRYFELRDALKTYRRNQSEELLFYRGVVSNKFNRLDSSVNYLQSYIKLAGRGTNRSLLKDSYEILADNYLKTYQYRKAAAAYKMLLTNFRGELDKAEDYENSLRLWGALNDVPPQTVEFRGTSKFQSFKDQAELTGITVEINGQTMSLDFDTGANLSIITKTYAGKLGLKLIAASIDVGGITGEKTKASLGVAREVKIGNVIARNVVFLVFEDRALYISPISFQLKGLIGFPVIAAFREITLARNGEIIIPAKPGKGGAQNMCIDDLNPIIEGQFQGKKLNFLLDTGANKSDLYPLFYKAYEKEIKANYPLSYTSRAGIGGAKEIPAYRAKNLTLTFSGKKAIFPEIKVLTEYTDADSHYFYGNLGQDLVRQFERMTLNFESMSIVFE